MTLYEIVKQLADNEKIYCATLRRDSWHPRITIWFEMTLGKENSDFFKKVALDDEDVEEDFTLWYPSIDDLIADDWIIKSTEEF